MRITEARLSGEFFTTFRYSGVHTFAVPIHGGSELSDSAGLRAVRSRTGRQGARCGDPPESVTRLKARSVLVARHISRLPVAGRFLALPARRVTVAGGCWRFGCEFFTTFRHGGFHTFAVPIHGRSELSDSAGLQAGRNPTG